MLRSLLFALSRSRIAAHVAANVPGFRGFSRRFVAGERQSDVIGAVRRLNAEGLEATVSFLGEEVTDERAVRAAIDEFTSYARSVSQHGLRSHISIKLTELGLAFDPELAARSLHEVLGAARDAGTFVRIDMEDSRYTEDTLALFREARRSYDNAGVVIQANLRRSADDIIRLAEAGAPVRLVKGAYREPEAIAYPRKQQVDRAFIELMEQYRAHMAPGGRLAVATHDARMISAARESPVSSGDGFEFQFLYGIRTDLARRLRRDGYRVRIYVPYGDQWYPYLMRRLAERPANAWFFLRNAYRRG